MDTGELRGDVLRNSGGNSWRKGVRHHTTVVFVNYLQPEFYQVQKRSVYLDLAKYRNHRSTVTMALRCVGIHWVLPTTDGYIALCHVGNLPI